MYRRGSWKRLDVVSDGQEAVCGKDKRICLMIITLRCAVARTPDPVVPSRCAGEASGFESRGSEIVILDPTVARFGDAAQGLGHQTRSKPGEHTATPQTNIIDPGLSARSSEFYPEAA